MKFKWLPFTILLIGSMVGCTALDQFPETVKLDEETLQSLDAEYLEAVKNVYGEADQSKRIDIRNQFIETRLAIVDAQFQRFIMALAAENAKGALAVDLAAIGAGSAGSLVSGGTSKVLSAVSAGLTGGQAAYDKSAFYDKALAALVAQMHASRSTIAASIFQRWSFDTTRYPLWMARQDIEAYQFAGSLPGAIAATASDAQDKEKKADAITFGKVTAEAASEKAFGERKTLREKVDALTAVQARSLLERVADLFPTSRALIEGQYSTQVQAEDEDGSKAKKLLRRLITLTAKQEEDRRKWQSAVAETTE